MTTKQGNFICETCNAIDFHDLLKNPCETLDPGEKAEPSKHVMRYTVGCQHCTLMFHGVPEDQTDSTFELQSFSFRSGLYGVRDDISLPGDRIVLEISRKGSNKSYSSGEVFCKLEDDRSEGLYCVQPMQEPWDYAKARFWLDVCLQCHDSACKRETLLVPGMNLIDCKDMNIVQAQNQMRWLALSYVWGKGYQTDFVPGYREGSCLGPDTPRTIKDALIVTLKLGYRYLWVDEYCIDQTDDNHRSDQIDKMDQIYRGADLTIVAAAGENKMYGLPGVGLTKRNQSRIVHMKDVIVFWNGKNPQGEVRDSKWAKRAWWDLLNS